jgi:hypothetical protein
MAFSSEADAGSRQVNASKKQARSDGPRRSGAVSMAGEDFGQPSRRARPLARGDGRLHDFGMVEEYP